MARSHRQLWRGNGDGVCLRRETEIPLRPDFHILVAGSNQWFWHCVEQGRIDLVLIVSFFRRIFSHGRFILGQCGFNRLGLRTPKMRREHRAQPAKGKGCFKECSP